MQKMDETMPNGLFGETMPNELFGKTMQKMDETLSDGML
jgi:hypothetical protein